MNTFTRHSLQGFRLASVYGLSPLSIRAAIRFERMLGKRSILEEMLPKCETVLPFANIHGEPCSKSYYARKKLSQYERERREIDARTERGERWAMMQRQAS